MKTPVVVLDTRGLAPPEPMVLILEALATLPSGSELHARTDRRPMHLYPMIEERGFRGETTPAPDHDHGFITVIHRNA
jgi:uncharacterized protein (DUF2249 family)